MTQSNASDSFDFSKSMQELEEITHYLESDDVQIEVAMQKFERGSELALQLKNYLENAENTISTLKKKFDS